MILILKGGGPEIDQPDFSVEQDSTLRSLPVDGGGGGGYFPVVCEGLVGVVCQEDVFRFEVGVYQIEIMQDYRSS